MYRRDFGRLAAALLLSGLFPCLSSCENNGDATGDLPSEEQFPAGVREIMAGAYGDYRALEEEERKLFSDTYKGGEALFPLKVKTQVVAGLNYRFLCKDAKDGKRMVEVTIFRPLPGNGEAEVSRIEEVKP